MSKTTIVLDSSQIACFEECQTLQYYQNIKKLQPLAREENEAMNAGTYGHKLLDIYYRARTRGLSLDEAAKQSFSYNPDTDTCECGCSLDSHKYLSQLNLTECHRCKSCLNFKAKPFALDSGIRMAVQNRLREYFFTYQSNDFIPLSEQHVEVGFSEPIYEDSENLFILEGRIDLIASIQGLNCIVDHKFQSQRYYLYPKTIQLKNYALIARVPMVWINYIRLTKSVDKTTLHRVPSTFTMQELGAWKQQLIGIYFKYKRVMSGSPEGIEHNWVACRGYSKTYDLDKPKWCPYSTLCEEWNPEMRQRREEQLFSIKTIEWKPW